MKENNKKGFMKRLFEKMDSKMKEKATKSCCCCCSDGDSDEKCSKKR